MEAPKLLSTQYPGLMSTYHTPHICGQCGAHIADDWSFCPECGTPTGLTQKDFEESARWLDAVQKAGTCTPMDTRQMSRCARCRNHHYDVEQKFFCRLGHQDVFSMQKDEGECPDFKRSVSGVPRWQCKELNCGAVCRRCGRLENWSGCVSATMTRHTWVVYLGELARAPMAYTRSDSQNLIVSLYQKSCAICPSPVPHRVGR